jgi:hypothetical protein
MYNITQAKNQTKNLKNQSCHPLLIIVNNATTNLIHATIFGGNSNTKSFIKIMWFFCGTKNLVALIK